MVSLQSNRGDSYEYDPTTSLIGVDGYWKCYDGLCLSGMKSEPVVIYVIQSEFDVECLLNWLREIPKSVSGHPNIICPTDYVEEGYDDNAKRKIRHLYIIGSWYNSVSLSNLMKGQINGINETPIEFAAQMYDLYQHNCICFAKTVAIEILKGLEHLHSKGVCIGCIDPDYIFFTADSRIAINFMGTYHWYLVKQASYLQSQTHHPVISLIGAIGPEHEKMIAPELLYGINDNRSDLYSLGIMLFSIVAGHLPSLSGKVPLDEIKNDQLRRIIMKATEMNYFKRYQSVLELVNALESSEDIDDVIVSGTQHQIKDNARDDAKAPTQIETKKSAIRKLKHILAVRDKYISEKDEFESFAQETNPTFRKKNERKHVFVVSAWLCFVFGLLVLQLSNSWVSIFLMALAVVLGITSLFCRPSQKDIRSITIGYLKHKKYPEEDADVAFKAFTGAKTYSDLPQIKNLIAKGLISKIDFGDMDIDIDTDIDFDFDD